MHLRHHHVSGIPAGGLRAVLLRGEEELRAGIARGTNLVDDATDGANHAIFTNGAGAGHELSAREVLLVELVNHRQGEHHARRRSTDVLQVVLHRDIPCGHRRHQHSQQRHVLVLGVAAQRHAGSGFLIRAANAELNLVARRQVTNLVLHLARLGNFLPVDCGDDVAALQRVRCRGILQHLRHLHLYRLVQVVHSRHRRGGLRLGKGLLVGLIDLLIRFALRNNGVNRHQRVIREHPPAQGLRHRHVRAHGHRGHVEMPGGLKGLRGVHLDHVRVLHLAQGIHRRPRPLCCIGHGQRDIRAGDVVDAEQRTSQHHRDRSPGQGAEAAGVRVLR